MRADNKVKLMFAGVQLAALVRVLADCFPYQPHWLYLASYGQAGMLRALRVALPASSTGGPHADGKAG